MSWISVSGSLDLRSRLPGEPAYHEAMAGLLATVLICEDEPALRELIRVSLQGPYEFAEADDGEESLAIARRLRPDLVILDVMMPRRSGIEVLTELRREEALQKGADRVIDKPFVPDDISTAVEEVLAARR